MTVTYVETREVDLNELTPFPGNAKKGDIPKIRASLRQGQYRSLVVRSMPGGALVVLAGNNTATAMREEGWTAARCEIVECDDDQARRINVKDNAISDRGVYDQSALAEIMASFAGDYAGVGFDDHEADALMAAATTMDADANAFLRSGDLFTPAPLPERDPYAGPFAPTPQPAEDDNEDDDEPPLVHEDVPATAAAYAETPEQEQARTDHMATRTPRVAAGTAEVVLVFTQEDRDEMQRLTAAAREVLGPDLRASDVTLRAMRTLVAVLDERHRIEPVRMGLFAKAAGASDVLD